MRLFVFFWGDYEKGRLFLADTHIHTTQNNTHMRWMGDVLRWLPSFGTARVTVVAKDYALLRGFRASLPIFHRPIVARQIASNETNLVYVCVYVRRGAIVSVAGEWVIFAPFRAMIWQQRFARHHHLEDHHLLGACVCSVLMGMCVCGVKV